MVCLATFFFIILITDPCPLLRQIAEGEAEAGHAGSKALRTAALRSLRRLIHATGDGDVLAFVLPGVASGLLRALLVAGVLALHV